MECFVVVLFCIFVYVPLCVLSFWNVPFNTSNSNTIFKKKHILYFVFHFAMHDLLIAMLFSCATCLCLLSKLCVKLIKFCINFAVVLVIHILRAN